MNKIRVLMVDGEVGFTRMTKITLEARGQCTVEVVNQPTEALSAARKFNPEIILLDFVMPGMDGSDVASLLQTEPGLRDVPIIFLTATARGQAAASDGLMSGGYRFLSKPIPVTDLMRCIETATAEKASDSAS